MGAIASSLLKNSVAVGNPLLMIVGFAARALCFRQFPGVAAGSHLALTIMYELVAENELGSKGLRKGIDLTYFSDAFRPG